MRGARVYMRLRVWILLQFLVIVCLQWLFAGW